MQLPVWRVRLNPERDSSTRGGADMVSESRIWSIQAGGLHGSGVGTMEFLVESSKTLGCPTVTSNPTQFITTGPSTASVTASATSRAHRKPHSKVKTGCLTCKIRKKKCDEAKPACRRCLDTGRSCDGYMKANASVEREKPVLFEELKSAGRDGDVVGHAQQQQQQDWKWQDCAQHPHWITNSTVSSSLTQASATSLLPVVCKGIVGRDCACTPHTSLHHTVKCLSHCPLYARVPSSLQLASSIEYTCFDFFRSKTGPGFGGWFDSGVWTGRMISACFISDVVLQAVAAVGAVHRRWEMGLTPEAFKWCEISDRLYREMLRTWKWKVRVGKERNEEVVEERVEVNMVLGKLCATFEAFQDEGGKARRWMTRAFEGLVGSDVKLVERDERMVDVTVSDAALVHYSLRLETELERLCGATRCGVEGSGRGEVEVEVELKDRFENMEEARDWLVAEVRAIWRIDYSVLRAEQMEKLQERHLERLMRWSVAYAGYAQVHRPNNDVLLKRIGRLLKWYREAAFLQLLLHTTDDALVEEAKMVPWDEPLFLANTPDNCLGSRHPSVQAQFARLCLLSDGLGDVPLALGLLGGVGNAEWKMHVGTSSCRSLAVRKRVRELLGGWGGRGLGVYSIAETVGEIEERVVLEAVESGLSGEARGPSAKWVDISYFVGEKMVCLLYCRDNVMAGRELVWVREWYKVQ